MAEIKSRTRIIRAPHDENNPYFMMCRNTAQDGRLSLEATGALTYLLSKPGDWQLQPSDIGNRGQCGQHRVYRILKELRDAGYVVRTYVRDDTGRITEVIYEVHEQPFGGFPQMDYPQMENGHITEYRKEQSTDSKDYLPSGKAEKTDDPTPLPELAIVTPKPKKSWPLLDAVKANWHFPPAANGMATHIATMLAGRSTTGKWAIGNLETPAEPEEVIRFVKWYHCRRPGKNLPLTPETLQLEFETFRDEKNREKNKTYFAEAGRDPYLLPIAQRKEGTFRDFRQALIDHGMWRNCGQGVVFYTSAWRNDKLVYIIGDDYNGLDTCIYETLANGSPDFTTEMTWEQFNEHYR